MKAMKRQISVLWDSFLYEIVAVLIGSLFGTILLRFIVAADKTVESYFTLGTVLGCVVMLIYTFVIAVSIPSYFNMEVSMGSTRKEFFWSYFIVCVLENMLLVCLLALICMAENAVCMRIYPTLGKEVDLLPYLLKFGVPASAALTIVGILCGALVMRFGKKAFWALWMLWMVCWIGGPRIHESMTEAPHSVFGIMGRAIREFAGIIPGNAWILCGVLCCAAGFAVSFCLIRRQQVQ